VVLHAPGIVTSIDFPKFVECNWKDALSQLNLRSKAGAQQPAAMEAGSQPAGGEGGRSAPRNSYDNMIERLERKYSKGIVPDDEEPVVSEDDGGDQDDDDDDNGAEIEDVVDMEVSGGEGGEAGERKPTAKSKKRSMAHQDAYDMEDDFIDDSEDAELIEMAMEGKSTKTKHGGFFASSGDLELYSVAAAAGVAGSSSSEAARGAGDMKALAVREQESDHYDVTGSTVLATSSQAGQGQGQGSKGGEKKSRVAKPDWEPTPSILIAMDAFKREVAGTLEVAGAERPKKNVFPRSLDNALCAFDKEVLQSIPNVESRYQGYWEALVDVLGGADMISVGIVKNSLKRLRLKARAEESLHNKEEAIRQLLELLPSKLTKFEPIVVPDDDDGGGGGEPSTLPQIFEWTCNWDIDTRGLLLAAEKTCDDWVNAENAYRRILTNLDKKGMNQEDTQGLEFKGDKGELVALLRKVEASFPKSCQNSDAACFRKQMNQERNRLSRKKAKAAKAESEGLGAGQEPGTGSAEAAAIPSKSPLSKSQSAMASSPAKFVAPNTTTAAPAAKPKKESAKDNKGPAFSTQFVAPPKFSITDFLKAIG
jgi:hypothetical protein